MTWDRWIRTVEVEPSLYAADFSRLGEQVEILLRTGARVFHFDIGDGHFVEPVTIGPIVLDSIAPLIHREGGAIDCHLMVDDPAHYFGALQTAGADSVTFHYEVVGGNAQAIAEEARVRGFQVGLAFNPETAVEDVLPYASSFDLLLCMSIHPGTRGRSSCRRRSSGSARSTTVGRRAFTSRWTAGSRTTTSASVYDAGADLIVAGSAIFGMEDLPRAYRRLVQLLA